MTKRYLGNIITQNPTAPAGPYEDSAASGVWSLAEAFAYSKAGLWPTAGRSQTAIYSGGGSPSATNIIQSFNLATTGNASDYGDLLGSLTAHTSFASSSRAVFAGGTNGADRIEYVTISSSGNAADFGNLITTGSYLLYPAGLSNSTRGIVAGGDNGDNQNIIQYITIATTGNATDFGDLDSPRDQFSAAASPTRGLFFGGSGTGDKKTIQYVTIATTSNTVDFGDFSTESWFNGSLSNSTRAVTQLGTITGSGYSSTMEYVTIATTGNSTDFGDILTSSIRETAGTSSATRGVFCGGELSSTNNTNVIQQITIANTGNATDFGDLLSSVSNGGATSSAHGGLA